MNVTSSDSEKDEHEDEDEDDHKVEQLRSKVANLELALDTARLIGTAIGILMERHCLTRDEAFQLLVRLSQRSHRKLRDVATDVIATSGRRPQ